jgi:hypothetical protein
MSVDQAPEWAAPGSRRQGAAGPSDRITVTDTVFGYPVRRLGDLPPGTYRAQAILNRYETFHRADGHVVKLPPDRWEGQQWARKPGNLYSPVVEFTLGPEGGSDRLSLSLSLTEEIPPVADFAEQETDLVKYVRIRSDLLSDFWGTDMYLGAWVLLPWGFDAHPEARYPLAIFHGHFPSSPAGFRTEPPDYSSECVYSARFDLDCYNHIQDSLSHQLYKDWIGPGFPRHLVVEVQHATPYYDDSYAVNSQAQGPYGDAIMRELVPEIERRFRGIGEGWARFTYGGSTGGWEAMAVQMFYPDDFNGAYVACPDPIDFRAYTVVNLYEDRNAYYVDEPFKRTPRPGHRNWLGQIDTEVAEFWRENYDLGHILRRDWPTLGPRLAGKLHVYVGDMDNYYLNNAVYLVEDFLESTTDPYYAGEVDYGDRAEHCWNGDHTRPNAISRLRYIQMYAPKMVQRMMESHPPGADLRSWRY